MTTKAKKLKGIKDENLILNFGATWCKPTKALKDLEEFTDETVAENYKHLYIDVEEYGDLVDELEIEGLPAVVLLKKGKEVWRKTGKMNKEELKKILG